MLGVVAFPVPRVLGCRGEQSHWLRQSQGVHSCPALPQPNYLLQIAFDEP